MRDSILLLLLQLLLSVASQLPRKFTFREYSVVPAMGTYLVPPASSVSACFLGPAVQMEAFEVDDLVTKEDVFERRVLRNLIPVPLLRQDVEQAIEQSMPSRTEGGSSISSISSSVLLERDGGLLDSLRFVFSQGGQIGSQERLDALLGRRGTNPNPTTQMAVSSSSIVMKSLRVGVENGATPYRGCVEALFLVLGLRVKGLLLEVADRPSDNSIFVGGAVLLGVERGEEEEEEDEWTADTALGIIRETQQRPLCSRVGAFLKCHADELVGLSLALGPDQLPIVVSRAISEQLEMDVLLQQRRRHRGTDDTRPTMQGPFFPNKAARDEWMGTQSSGNSAAPEQGQQQRQQEQEQQQQQQEQQQEQQPKPKPQLLDAATFLALKPSERRAWLRSQVRGGSSNTAMPRPREGTLALNAACYAWMDINVVYEVLRRLAESNGDEAAAASCQDFESIKPGLAKDILVAEAAGDVAGVKELTARLQAAGRLPYHPFRPNLITVEEGFDVEEWFFLESRSLQGQRAVG